MIQRSTSTILIAAFCTLLNLACSSSTPPAPKPTAPLSDTDRMQWWRDAHFGMFIHFGLYAIPAGEWKGEKTKGIGEWIMKNRKVPVNQYEMLADQFNPVDFDANEWVQIAKNAGMKYIVITSKHHDGFSLFDSKVSKYNIMSTPFKRDIMKELSDAAHKEGIQICWYHSIMDWHNADSQTADRFPLYRDNQLKPQLKELLTHYGDIGILWFDGEWINEWTEEQGKDLYAYCRSIQPNLIINNRVGKGRKGMNGLNKTKDAAGDYSTPEQNVPSTRPSNELWESCMTMNDTWGYRSDDHNWKSSEKLIRTLIDIASKGGNFLLNVGPDAKGKIPDASVARLHEIGQWMKVNGESIYGTTASPLTKYSFDGRCTTKGNHLYVHVFKWPKEGIHIEGVQYHFLRSARFLSGETASLWDPSTNAGWPATLRISSPVHPDPIATVIDLEFDSPPTAITAPTPASRSHD